MKKNSGTIYINKTQRSFGRYIPLKNFPFSELYLFLLKTVKGSSYFSKSWTRLNRGLRATLKRPVWFGFKKVFFVVKCSFGLTKGKCFSFFSPKRIDPRHLESICSESPAQESAEHPFVQPKTLTLPELHAHQMHYFSCSTGTLRSDTVLADFANHVSAWPNTSTSWSWSF